MEEDLTLSKGDARLWEQDKWTRSSKGLHNPLPILYRSIVNPALINKSKWTEEEGNPTLSKGDARLWEQDIGTRTEEHQFTRQDATPSTPESNQS